MLYKSDRKVAKTILELLAHQSQKADFLHSKYLSTVQEKPFCEVLTLFFTFAISL